MGRKPILSEEEQRLFQEAVDGVRPLMSDTIEPPTPALPAIPHQRLRDEAEVMRDIFSDDGFAIEELETGEELLHWRPGLQHQVLKKLRRGHYSVGAELDLHGYTVTEARQALSAFLEQCLQKNLRCVRIIHGKGNGSLNRLPVLKGKVNHWLRQRDEVLAFTSARPADGGTGALYVLLKRAPSLR
jgi:DNA-nicking Smr family endonuclease